MDLASYNTDPPGKMFQLLQCRVPYGCGGNEPFCDWLEVSSTVGVLSDSPNVDKNPIAKSHTLGGSLLWLFCLIAMVFKLPSKCLYLYL